MRGSRARAERLARVGFRVLSGHAPHSFTERSPDIQGRHLRVGVRKGVNADTCRKSIN